MANNQLRSSKLLVVPPVRQIILGTVTSSKQQLATVNKVRAFPRMPMVPMHLPLNQGMVSLSLDTISNMVIVLLLDMVMLLTQQLKGRMLPMGLKGTTIQHRHQLL